MDAQSQHPVASLTRHVCLRLRHAGLQEWRIQHAAREPGTAFNPEFAWSYEGGLKHTMAGGRVRTNTAVFHTDYHDLQVQSFVRPGVPDISNAGSATIRGVEVEVDAAAGHGLHLAGHVSWLEATYDRYLATVPGGATHDAAGNRLNNAPEWSGSGSAVYEFATGRRGTVRLRGDVSWQSRVFFTPFNNAIETQPAYGLVHLRAGFEPRSRDGRSPSTCATSATRSTSPARPTSRCRRSRPPRRSAPLGHAVHPPSLIVSCPRGAPDAVQRLAQAARALDRGSARAVIETSTPRAIPLTP